MKQHRKLIANLIFAAVVVAIAVGLLLARRANQSGASLTAQLMYGDSNSVLTFPLDKDDTYDVDTGYLTVHIEVRDGAARFMDSPCPDHVCESFGWLSEEGAWAACVPAGVYVQLVPEGEMGAAS